jgi:tetratricopeptide (TPR) repeat protein
VFAASQAFRDPRAFAGIVSEYQPGFVLVPVRAREFASWVGRVADYRPVFADDASVLYANAQSQAELVGRYELAALDPFALAVTGDRGEAAAQLARANEIHPAGARLRVFEGALALQRGEPDTALRMADDVLQRHPADPDALRLRGDVLFGKQDFSGAARAYEAALAEPAGDGRELLALQTRLYACYIRLERPADAYALIRRALGDLYRSAVGYRELAALANTALDAGDVAAGRTLLEFALAKTPPEEAELRRSLEARLRTSSPAR